MRWMGHVACMGEMRNAYKILFRNSKGKRSLRRPSYKWEDNTRINVREAVDWIHLAGGHT